jgi:hypothetical protein
MAFRALALSWVSEDHGAPDRFGGHQRGMSDSDVRQRPDRSDRAAGRCSTFTWRSFCVRCCGRVTNCPSSSPGTGANSASPWATSTSPTARPARNRRHHHQVYLRQRWDEGVRSTERLHAEMRDRGYRGSQPKPAGSASCAASPEGSVARRRGTIPAGSSPARGVGASGRCWRCCRTATRPGSATSSAPA